jgi:hypothetical protein
MLFYIIVWEVLAETWSLTRCFESMSAWLPNFDRLVRVPFIEEDRALGYSTGPRCAESWPSSNLRIRCSSPQIPEHYMAHLSIAHTLHSSPDVQRQIEFVLEKFTQEAKIKLERVKLCDRHGHAVVRHEAHASTWRSHVTAWIAPAAACICACLAGFF